jgi:hypothetical protein
VGSQMDKTSNTLSLSVFQASNNTGWTGTLIRYDNIFVSIAIPFDPSNASVQSASSITRTSVSVEIFKFELLRLCTVPIQSVRGSYIQNPAVAVSLR